MAGSNDLRGDFHHLGPAKLMRRNIIADLNFNRDHGRCTVISILRFCNLPAASHYWQQNWFLRDHNRNPVRSMPLAIKNAWAVAARFRDAARFAVALPALSANPSINRVVLGFPFNGPTLWQGLRLPAVVLRCFQKQSYHRAVRNLNLGILRALTTSKSAPGPVALPVVLR